MEETDFVPGEVVMAFVGINGHQNQQALPAEANDQSLNMIVILLTAAHYGWGLIPFDGEGELWLTDERQDHCRTYPRQYFTNLRIAPHLHGERRG